MNNFKIENNGSLINFQHSTKFISFAIFAVVTYMPQDFRCSLFKQQRERSERRKQAEVDAVISSGGSIRDKYSLLWKQQMERWVLQICIT
jgi:hypothetical protein